jgi:Mn-dependent DtxR family transcriptional regulator
MRLDQKDKDVIRIIQTHRRSWGTSPTYAELAERMVVSTPTMFRRIAKLMEYGLVAVHSGRHRSLEPTVLGREWAFGRVSDEKVRQHFYEEH